jgi:CDP-diacylglycerol---glycerol-3-phosphate 3-phosphatidyltransferase
MALLLRSTSHAPTLSSFASPYLSRSLYAARVRGALKLHSNPAFLRFHSQAPAEPLQPIRDLLSETCLKFRMHGSALKILTTPTEFYEALLAGVQGARQRVCLSSLYLGSGQLESKLVQALVANAEQNKSTPSYRASVLFDHSRGLRGKTNSATMLAPWQATFPSGRLSLYHSPTLRGLLRFLPSPFNETIGVNHLKVYAFDDHVLLSGANLSHDYFTHRQDRYMLFKDRALADFFCDLVDVVSEHSLQHHPDGRVTAPAIHPYSSPKADYCTALVQDLEKLIVRHHQRIAAAWPSSTSTSTSTTSTPRLTAHASNTSDTHPSTASLAEQCHSLASSDSTAQSAFDTEVFPTLQLGPCGLTHDAHVTKQLLHRFDKNWRVQFATGYFNLVNEYIEALLASGGRYSIVTASPHANGFLGARGIMGHVPAAYTHIAAQFLTRVAATGNTAVTLCEYERPGWTFHAKGMWAWSGSEGHPCVTLIGSPNFGYRSVHRDLEAQVAVTTTNKDLQARLAHEAAVVSHYSSPVRLEYLTRPPRRAVLWERMATNVIKSFF